MAMTLAQLWLYQCQGSQNHRGRKGAWETMGYTQQPLQLTPYLQQPHSSGCQDARRTKALCFPYLSKSLLRIRLWTRTFRPEGLLVHTHQGLQAANPLPGLHRVQLSDIHYRLAVESLPLCLHHLTHLTSRLAGFTVHLRLLAAHRLS